MGKQEMGSKATSSHQKDVQLETHRRLPTFMAMIIAPFKKTAFWFEGSARDLNP